MAPQQQFDARSNFPDNYSSPYSVQPQMESYQAPVPSPPMSPSISASSAHFTSPEQRPTNLPSEGSGKGSKKPVVRRSYHPNPPAHRSEWVMWAGNVPSDATREELWRFFNSFPEPSSETTTTSGVLSIFPISRSSCAFVNYEDEHHLEQAIGHFNGQPLRPGDARCPKLVCRVRKRDDDLKAGVGGQRGIGLHMRWIKEQKARAAQATGELDAPAEDTSLDSLREITTLSISSDDDLRHRRTRNSSSGSHASASTTMAGPIRQGEPKVSWATRTSDSASSGSSRSPPSAPPDNKDSTSESSQGGQMYLYFPPTAERFVDQSPLSVGGDNHKQETESTEISSAIPQSAPAEFGDAHRKMTLQTIPLKHSLDQLAVKMMRDAPSPVEDFELDISAPARAVRSGYEGSIPTLEVVTEEGEKGEEGEKEGDGGKEETGKEKEGHRDDWGESFKVEWLSTEKIPFQRTKHIRNPWNHDREVKVSRDGTELEPSVGRKLLDEWAPLAAKRPPTQSAGTKVNAISKRGTKPTMTLPEGEL
ncbi:hypothetical protein H0H87_006210 [Tephrocybe sp. NHM501043]|nr:hypothetical protein H0H87_006210 [Tephrocybe sp. NHM501043]